MNVLMLCCIHPISDFFIQGMVSISWTDVLTPQSIIICTCVSYYFNPFRKSYTTIVHKKRPAYFCSVSFNINLMLFGITLF
ncbi:hypothetical protein FKM82_022762 [Ascaphus truei]